MKTLVGDVDYTPGIALAEDLGTLAVDEQALIDAVADAFE